MYWGKHDTLQTVLTFINYCLDCGDNMHCHVTQLFIQQQPKKIIKHLLEAMLFFFIVITFV